MFTIIKISEDKYLQNNDTFGNKENAFIFSTEKEANFIFDVLGFNTKEYDVVMI